MPAAADDSSTVPGPWGHLALRFIDVVTADSLTAPERCAVEGWLDGPAESSAFFAQPPADQRHGYAAALIVLARRPGRPDLVKAALLHDVGKRHAGLGPLARVVASVAIRLRLPLSGRWEAYRDHGDLAAAELSASEPIVGAFARHHHGARPSTIDADDWAVLVAADAARVGR